MPEIAWPGEELDARERAALASLVLDGWRYMYCDGEDFAMQSPDQIGTKSWWRIKRDGTAPPVRVSGKREVPAPSSIAELTAKLLLRAKTTPPVDLDCKDRRPGASLKQVRSLIRQGYSAQQVTQMTGWGAYWFADLLGADGYYDDDMEREKYA